MKRICMVGTGYVGLVTGACFAELGNQVTCLDVLPAKIARLQAGDLPFYEPGLDALVARNAEAQRLRFTTSYAEAIAAADFIFIAVSTPALATTGAADTRYVEAAARSIAEHLTGPAIIVTKSTVPVGSGARVLALLREHLRDPRLAVRVVSNPEFLREGSAVADFMRPDRVVVGASEREAAQAVAQLYAPLNAVVVQTDMTTAEMIKYASNAFLATKISFINEIARICDGLGADVTGVAAGMGFDHRIGRAFLDAGLGYGGSCFSKDVSALVHMAIEASARPHVLPAVTTVNREQRYLPVQRLEDALGGPGALAGGAVALLGLSFKANTDDLRDAPSMDIIRWLLKAGVRQIRAFDPVCTDRALLASLVTRQSGPDELIQHAADRLILCADAYDAAAQTDGVILVTDWACFRTMDLARIYHAMRPQAAGRVFVDGRNVFDPGEMTRQGFRYLGIGRTGSSNDTCSGLPDAERRSGDGAQHGTPDEMERWLTPAGVVPGYDARVVDLLADTRLNVGPGMRPRAARVRGGGSLSVTVAHGVAHGVA